MKSRVSNGVGESRESIRPPGYDQSAVLGTDNAAPPHGRRDPFELPAAEPNTASTPLASGARADYAAIEAELGAMADRWVWPGWLAGGFITLVAADKGGGKSAVVLTLLVRNLLLGEPFPDGAPGLTGGKIVVADTEAGQHMTVSRLRAMGADLSLVQSPLADGLARFSLDNRKHVESLLAALRDPAVKAALLDSYSGGTKGDEVSSTYSRHMFELAAALQRIGKPLVVIHHLHKKERGPGTDPHREITIEDVRGHTSLTQTARVIVGIDAPDPADLAHKRLRVMVSNLGPPPAPLGFRWVGDGVDGRIVFDTSPPAAPQRESELARAKRLIIEYLAKAAIPVPASEAREFLKEQGVATRTLDRAKAELQVRSEKVGRDWLWSLRSW